MSDLVERLAKAMLVFDSPAQYVKQFPDGGWSILLDDRGRDYWRGKARHALETIRDLPEEPGPRYSAGEYSRRNHEAMVDDALGQGVGRTK
jgi:hypothetical protein